jgi:hypothetical protein
MKLNLAKSSLLPVLLIPLVLFSLNHYLAENNSDSTRADSMWGDPIDSLAQDSVMIPDSAFGDTIQEIPPRRLDRVVPNKAFDVGEKLSFDIRWKFLTAGHATMEVQNKIMVHDSFPAYQIVSTAQSTRTIDVFFKVRDKVESILDSRGIFSWGFRKSLREGSYKFDLFVDYDQLYGKANIEMIRYHNDDPLRIRKKEEFELAVPKYVIDILGSFYYVRTQRLRVGDPIYITNHDNKSIYKLKVIIQRREQVKVKAGKFNCVVVQPQLKGDAIFKQKGKLWVWLTDDELKIPVQMKSKAFIGSVVTELTKIEGIKKPITAMIK